MKCSRCGIEIYVLHGDICYECEARKANGFIHSQKCHRFNEMYGAVTCFLRTFYKLNIVSNLTYRTADILYHERSYQARVLKGNMNYENA